MTNRAEDLQKRRGLLQEYATKIVLTLTFFVLFMCFIAGARATGKGLEFFGLGVLDVVLVGFATVRLGRLVAYSHVMEPLRAPFTATIPDDTGAGETVEARGTGARYAIGQLLSCPICVGTWCAAFLVYGLNIFPGPTYIFIYMTAAIGIAELLNSLVEALSWSGQLTRTRTGERRNHK